MKANLLKYNLQFFADGDAESVETPDVAEPVEGEGEVQGDADSGDNSQEEQQSEPQVDINAVAAAARRQAEEAARIRQSKVDAEFARRFGHLKNPLTGMPIQTQADYLAALDAQEKQIAEDKLKQSGVDPGIINHMIANNPAIRQAQELIAQAHQNEVINQINNDVAILSQIDSTIQSLEDVPPEVIQHSMSTNMSLVDSYKVINYGRVSNAKQEAIQQAAINQAKGKQHMAPMNGVSTPDGGVDIPASEIAMWKDIFPDKSMSELKKLYNETL